MHKPQYCLRFYLRHMWKLSSRHTTDPVHQLTKYNRCVIPWRCRKISWVTPVRLRSRFSRNGGAWLAYCLTPTSVTAVFSKIRVTRLGIAATTQNAHVTAVSISISSSLALPISPILSSLRQQQQTTDLPALGSNCPSAADSCRDSASASSSTLTVNNTYSAIILSETKQQQQQQQQNNRNSDYITSTKILLLKQTHRHNTQNISHIQTHYSTIHKTNIRVFHSNRTTKNQIHANRRKIQKAVKKYQSNAGVHPS